MRPIDADALKQSVREKFKGLSDRCEINELVNAAPTIDAIPVEWIKARHKNWCWDSERSVCERFLLNDWRKEQEGR